MSVGNGVTVTVDVDKLEVQPFAVYETVYGVVVAGLTEMVLPVPPVDHAYVPPAGEPVATRVADAPKQIVWLPLVKVGTTFTVT